MEILSKDLDIEAFFRKVTTARKRLLLLDYDGTLAPFRVERDQAFPYTGVAELLGEICRNQLSRVVIISGRSVQDVTVPSLKRSLRDSYDGELSPEDESRIEALKKQSSRTNRRIFYLTLRRIIFSL